MGIIYDAPIFRSFTVAFLEHVQFAYAFPDSFSHDTTHILSTQF